MEFLTLIVKVVKKLTMQFWLWVGTKQLACGLSRILGGQGGELEQLIGDKEDTYSLKEATAERFASGYFMQPFDQLSYIVYLKSLINIPFKRKMLIFLNIKNTW